MENAIMQSSWIQRLNPSCQTSALEDEEPEPSPVWTHFTKDFSSCSKRLHKTRHHTRSSSWPPNERTTKCSPSPDLKPVEPVDMKEQFLLSRATLRKFREENFCVPFRDGSESNTLKTGNLFSSQNSSHKSIEALVPSSQAVRTCDNFRAGASNSKAMCKNSAAQHLCSKFNKESGCLLEVISPRVLGDAPSVSELAHTMAHTRGSSPDAVIGTSVSPALMGASADADERTCIFRPPTKSVYLSTPSKLSINKPAVVFGDTENKSNNSLSGMVLNNNRVKVYGKETKTRRNFGFLHVAGQSKKLNPFGANPCIRSGPCISGRPDIAGADNGGFGLSPASKSNQRTHTVGFGTLATNAGPFVSKKIRNLQSLNKDLGRCDPVVADCPCTPKEEMDTEMPLTRVPSGEFKRASCKETLDEYWVQLFEDSGPAKLFDTSYQKAMPPQEHLTGGRYRSSFNWTKNSWKPDEVKKLKSFPHPSALIAPKSNAEISTPCVLLPQSQVSLRSGFIQTEQTCLGHDQGASTNKNPLVGTSVLKAWQEESLQGGMRSLASETGKIELLCDDGRITKPSKLNKAWIQRWQSSSNLIALSEETSFGMDKEEESAPEKRWAFSGSKNVKGTDCVNCNLQEPTGISKLQHIDGSARCYETGLGATLSRGSFPVSKCYATNKHMAPSVKAMAIVGNTAGKLHTTSLKNRGSFSIWPCPNVENFQEKRLLEPQETVDDNMHEVDMDDLEFWERKMR